MKLCKCGRLATHTITILDFAGTATGKKLACDHFPNCQPRPASNSEAK